MSVQVLFASGPTEVPCSGFQEHSCGSYEGDSRHRSGTDSSYQPCPETVISSRLGRGLRSSVQMAPTTVQSKWATTHPALVASSHNRGSYSASGRVALKAEPGSNTSEGRLRWKGRRVGLGLCQLKPPT